VIPTGPGGRTEPAQQSHKDIDPSSNRHDRRLITEDAPRRHISGNEIAIGEPGGQAFRTSDLHNGPTASPAAANDNALVRLCMGWELILMTSPSKLLKTQ